MRREIALKEKKYPYQNLSLEDIPGEQWKDIPGFEGMYQVSTFGRVKSLERTFLDRWGKPRPVPMKIRRTKIDLKFNKTIQETLYSLGITLCKNATSYHYSLGRLVYCLFIAPFDLNDHSIYISYKDKDGRNLHVSNLIKTDITTIKRKSFKAGRAHIYTSRPVTQFNVQGEPLKTYNSFRQAAIQNGWFGRGVGPAAAEIRCLYKGYIWKEGHHADNIDTTKIFDKYSKETLHTSLMERIGNYETDPEKILPVLNLSVKNMKNEIWKDIPGHEGFYQISNMGRVKILKKITQGKMQKFIPTKIQRLNIDFVKDASGNEIPYRAYAFMHKNGKKHVRSLPRLVYYMFGQVYDMDDFSIKVHHKDGNPLNARIDNLYLEKEVYAKYAVKEIAEEPMLA